MKEDSQDPKIEPELEARIVALVLGEASDFERDELNRLIEERPELATLKEQIQNVHGLLRDVGTGELVDNDGDWKLPAEKRSAVLAAMSGDVERQSAKTGVKKSADMRRTDRPGYWNLTRIAAVFCVVGFFGSVVFFFTGSADSRRAPQLASNAANIFDSKDWMDAMEEWENAGSLQDTSYGYKINLEETDDSLVQSTESSESTRLDDATPALEGIRGALNLGNAVSTGEVRDADAAEGWRFDSASRHAKEEAVPNAYFFDTAGLRPTDSAVNVADQGIVLHGGVKLLVEPRVIGVPNEVDFSTPALNDDFGTTRQHAAPVAAADGTAAFSLGRSPVLERDLGRRGVSINETQPLGRENRRLSEVHNRFAGEEFGQSADLAMEGESLSGGNTGYGGGGYGGAGLAPVDELRRGKSISAGQQPETRDKFGFKAKQDSRWGEASADQPAAVNLWAAPINGRDPLVIDGRVANESWPSERRKEALELGTRLAIKNQNGLGANSSLPMLGGDDAAGGFLGPVRKEFLEGTDIFVVRDQKRDVDRVMNTMKQLQRAATPTGLNEKTTENELFSTFSLHVSDVSFKLARAALAQSEWPDAANVRIEEFVNAFDYGDPLPSQNEKVACRLEQSIHPFLQQRNLLRVSLRTAAAGRSSSTPLRLTLLLDNSGSMERPDRQQALRRAFALLTQQLKPIDQVTLISFARQPRLLADKVNGTQSSKLVHLIHDLPSEGGTNLEAALQLAFEKAQEQQVGAAQNRIILLTDGAVNLGDADPPSLSRMITTMRNAGISFDAAGISAEGLNDEVLEALTRKGDGRYYLLDSLEVADDGFARQIAGALRPSAKNVKVQIEFNPKRVGRYKLLGFEKHRLKQEDFRNDKVDAAEMAAAEAGVALYQFEAKPDGEGDVGSVSVRFRDLSTGQMIENRWPIPYESDAPRPDQATPALRIATSAALLAAKLRGEPLGEAVDLKTLSDLIAGLPERDRDASRVRQLQQMIQQARQVSGK